MASDLRVPVKAGDCPQSIREIFRHYITVEEEIEIRRQFDNTVRQAKGLVLWSGILRQDAETWAAERGLHTLAMAMGPLMRHRCAGTAKTKYEMLMKYMRGASAVFTWYAARNQTVIALTPPPPERFHPSGGTNFQVAEVPVIIEWARLYLEDVRVMLLHPTVKGAEDSSYQIWPIDETEIWTAQFGRNCPKKIGWRRIKMPPGRPCLNILPEPGTPNPEVRAQLVNLFMNVPRSYHKSVRLILVLILRLICKQDPGYLYV
jgi:hypothetical protein